MKKHYSPTDLEKDAMRLFSQQLMRHRRLRPSEEIDLARKARGGDEKARQELILCNLRLVFSIARKYSGRCRHLTLLDLVMSGTESLVKQVLRFDPDTGFRFSTYMSHWIRHGITRAIADRDRLIRVPVHALEQSQHDGGSGPEGETDNRLLALLIKSPPISLETALADSETPHNLQDTLDPTDLADFHGAMADNPERQVIAAERAEYLRQALTTLKPRELAVIRCRFVLDLTLEETAIALHREMPREPKTRADRQSVGNDRPDSQPLTRERVRQIETNALKKLAKALKGLK